LIRLTVWIVAAPEVSGEGIMIRSLASGFRRSVHDAGIIVAAVLQTMPVVMSLVESQNLSGSLVPGAQAEMSVPSWAIRRPRAFRPFIVTESAISGTSGCGLPAANSASSLAMTLVVPARNHSTVTPG
jgi:hypothetical protein